MIRKKRHPTQAPLISLQNLPLRHTLNGVIVKMTNKKSNRKPIWVLQYYTQYPTGHGSGGDKLPLRRIEEADPGFQLRRGEAYKIIAVEPSAVLRSRQLGISVQVVLLYTHK